MIKKRGRMVRFLGKREREREREREMRKGKIVLNEG
jgi:hypothetical protein